ncbi:hypothetical protein NYE80_01355 [Paenibacillus sp. FSL H7-0357]|nr:hypothetical protein [Paenibacillus sp. FSL H7-0357]
MADPALSSFLQALEAAGITYNVQKKNICCMLHAPVFFLYARIME